MALIANSNTLTHRQSSGRGPLTDATNKPRMQSTSAKGSGPGGAAMAAQRSIRGCASRRRLVSSSSVVSGIDDVEGESDPDGGAWDATPRRPSQGSRRSLNSRIVSQGPHRSSSRADAVASSDLSAGSIPSSRTASSSYTNRSGMSALARANARRTSMALGGGLAGGVTSAPVQKLTVDSTSFEEWMKMATDNKINSTNTFSIALIDYFHDMSLLRSDSGDGSINFQKASCTLDGCVKVWTSRVDSVVNETGKLLNGLVGDSKGSVDDLDTDGEVELDEDGNPISAKGKKDKRKKAKAKEATLAKTFSAIAVKKLDLEYTVDPLFKKTSADFDEGGAGGLLMNHLGVDDKMRIVFDAGDAPGLPEASDEPDSSRLTDESHEDDDSEGRDQSAAAPTAPRDLIDISRLQAKLFSLAPPSLLAESSDPIGALLNGRLICPSLARFSFAPDQEDALLGQDQDDDGDHGVWSLRESTPFDLGPMNPAITATPWGGHDNDFVPSHYADGNDDPDSDADLFGVPAELDHDGDVFGMPTNSSPSMHHSQGALANDPPRGEGQDFFPAVEPFEQSDGAQVQWNPRHGPSQHDLMLAFKGVSGNDDGGNDGADADQRIGGLFDYFDQKLMKSWAGPEHWKMHNRLAGFGSSAPSTGKLTDEGSTQVLNKRKQAPREAFTIDFVNSEAPSTRDIFEQPKSLSSIMLPKSRSKPEAYLLPEDRHFTSRRLLRLFSKPRAVLNIRTRKGAIRFGEASGLPGFGGVARADGEIDAKFWAKQQAIRLGANADDSSAGDYTNNAAFDDDAPMPLDTQFYHDGNEEGAFELASALPQMDATSAADVDMADFEEDDLVAQATALKRVKPEFVNYAKKAKRVDVRKLKENIWRELEIDGVIPQEEGERDSTEPEPPSSSPQRSIMPGEPKVFRNVLTRLRKVYPKEKMDEISTSFCFICLLHLANEEGLEIKIGDSGGDPTIKTDGQGRHDVLRRVTGAFGVTGRIVKTDEEDSEGDVSAGEAEDDDVDELGRPVRVGRLEYLKIEKDPNAGRSA